MATCEALVNSMPKIVKAVLKKMMATQNIDTLGPIWTFSLRDVLTFVASGLDINGSIELFWGESNLHCYTSFTLTTLHCSKVSFLQCYHMKGIIKYLQKCEGCTHFCEILYFLRHTFVSPATSCLSSKIFEMSIISVHFCLCCVYLFNGRKNLSCVKKSTKL